MAQGIAGFAQNLAQRQRHQLEMRKQALLNFVRQRGQKVILLRRGCIGQISNRSHHKETPLLGNSSANTT